MKETELKPCPFCGGKAEVRFVSDKVPFVLKKYHYKYIFAGCRKCGIVTALYNAFNNTRSPLKNEANIEKKPKSDRSLEQESRQ